MKRISEATQLEWAIRAQQNWIRDHGSTLAGYIAYYATQVPSVYTLGEVQSILAADRAYLAKLESQVRP